jgi:hypothetical protein
MIKLGNILETKTKISSDKEVQVNSDFLTVFGRRGKLTLDKKSMRFLVGIVRQNMGYTYEATSKMGKSQSKLPNGTKVKMDTNKGLMLTNNKGIVVKLNRKELTALLRAAKKRMRIT